MAKNSVSSHSKKQMEHFRRAIQELERSIDAEVNRHLPHKAMWLSIDFQWGCDESPFGWCAYEKYEDPAHDSCIFCGDPQERK